jgi:hypothetical protein
MSYKSTEELNKMGTDGIAREAMIKGEALIKDAKDLFDTVKEKKVTLSYAEEDEPAKIPTGRVPFTGLLLTCNREGNRPKSDKIFKTANIWPIQEVVKVGPNVNDIVVGDKVLVNTITWELRGMAAPTVLLEVDGENREYLLISDRDVKYIY